MKDVGAPPNSTAVVASLAANSCFHGTRTGAERAAQAILIASLALTVVDAAGVQAGDSQS